MEEIIWLSFWILLNTRITIFVPGIPLEEQIKLNIDLTLLKVIRRSQNGIKVLFSLKA